MRKLLNTVYITNELAYLSLDGENFVCKIDNEVKLRIPFDNVEGIVCFNYVGCSPALMGKCVSRNIPINFISPSGKFLAKICGETKGNVFLRVAQIDKFREADLQLTQNTIASKLYNTGQVIKRTLHDNAALRSDEEIQAVLAYLKEGINKVYLAENIEGIIGIEGNCAKMYFSVFNKLLTNSRFTFAYRNKRPPLDPINAVLSLVYTLYQTEYAAALETVGLDSYIGYCHKLRSGRNSLACDLMEETRCIAERFTLTMFNLQILKETDFVEQTSGAVYLNDEGRKKILSKWQEKKRTDIMHPVLKQKIQLGLLPYVQSNLLAKYIRGDLDEYPCFLLK